ncbi:AAA family ATPase [Aliiglaciecola sp. 3_MG-2023]|uniref:AAA family ATPase n=1 Tax=Aliiglaciecola sp. 3_MG-2023 TaxID=3062644 RepID=UPI0026E3C593|nr:AAA family ATPase [Aliiglaciecola sp. 3_MG-2023]MDO6693555.1 AAA family ATPase [Aliiglaciecola sp. 3_MG-2023]
MSNKKAMKTNLHHEISNDPLMNQNQPKVDKTVEDEFDQDFADIFDELLDLDIEEDVYDSVKKDLKALGPVRDKGQIDYQSDKFDPNKIAIVDLQKLQKVIEEQHSVSINNEDHLSTISAYKNALVCTIEMAQKVASLIVDFPNFSHVIEDLVDRITLLSISSKHMSVQSINLQGSPGVGKTTFVRALAAALGVDFFDLTISAMMSKFELCGGNPHWKNATCGRLAEYMLKKTNNFQPIILLDDLCSVYTGTESEHTLLPVLLNILEPHQAKHFKDQFYDLEIDLSGVIFISTTNKFSRLPENIQSRLSNYEIDLPEGDQFSRVVQNIYQGLVVENDLSDIFSKQLNEAVIGKLQNTNLRHIKRLLTRAINQAYKRSAAVSLELTQIAVSLADLNLLEKNNQSGLPECQRVLH